MISRNTRENRENAVRKKISVQKKKITLSEELFKMKQLAGILSESDSESAQARLSATIGMILKLDGATENNVEAIEIPTEPNGSEMTKLPSDMLHITLTGVRNFNLIHDKARENGFSVPMFIQNIRYYIQAPNVELGEAKFVYRDENGDSVYSPNGKVSYVVAIENQDEIRNYVNEIYNELELENPEPDRFYHITLANNAGGDSFKSIGNVNRKDFE